MCKQIEKSKDGHLVSRSDSNEFCFGIISSKIIKKMSDKANSNTRGEASEMLLYEIGKTLHYIALLRIFETP